jgi:RND superfamily putative drug exporter
MRIGPAVYRWRWLILLAWLAGGAALCALAPELDPAACEPTSFLPPDAPYSQAAEALQRSFPRSGGLSQAIVVFERADAKCSPADFLAVESVAAAIARPHPPQTTASDLKGICVRSPDSLSLAGLSLPANPLKSPDGHAALIVVDVPAYFITMRSSHIVDHVRAVVQDAKLPPGLVPAVTGSSGFGHDYAFAAEASHRRIGLVTIIAVVVILLLVYRSPVAALAPLVAISAAAVVAMKVLAFGQHFGMHVGTAEKVFVFVLIYGAGMDYSMLFISRFRERLAAGCPTSRAAGEGLGATVAAILASAGTNTLGLLMTSFAEYRIFRTAGIAIAAALIVAMIASITLVPALTGILGRWLFWPGKHAGRTRQARLWPAVATTATRRPVFMLLAVIILLAIPAARGAKLTWVYDALAELNCDSPGGVGNAAVGIEAAKRHWPVGQVAPITVLVQSPKPLSVNQWTAMSAKLTAAIAAASGVQDVRSLSAPLGRKIDPVTDAMLVAANIRQAAEKTLAAFTAGLAAGGRKPRPENLDAAGQIQAEYLAENHHAMRLQVVLDKPSLTLAAMDDLADIRKTVEKTLANSTPTMSARFLGATAEMAQIRIITQADFRRIAPIVLAVIFVMILLLLRDAILAAFITAATLLSYFATLGLAYWLIILTGQAGLDWKVEVFLFVVMVAVGVDYSIFLAARVSQEARNHPVPEAVRNALVHTGPVISSCGLIMAATLGSLMAGQLKLFVQLGLALALGMLIDTFIVRPLLLPAFITLVKRTGNIPRFLE